MKSSHLTLLLFSIFVVVFNVIFFMFCDSFSATRWISYVIIHLAYGIKVYTCMKMPNAKGSAVYGYPRIYIASIYFISELIIGILFILINNDSPKYPFLVQFILFALFIIIFLILVIADKHSIANDQEDSCNIYFIKDASYRLSETMSQINDRELQKNVEKLYDAVRSAQVKTIPEVADMEAKLMYAIDSICSSALTGKKDEVKELVAESIIQLNSRNSRIKLSKT